MFATLQLWFAWGVLLAGFGGLVAWQWLQYSRARRQARASELPAILPVVSPATLSLEATDTVSPSSQPIATDPQVPEAGRRRLRELGIVPGLMQCGAHNAITDVPGVKVGHATIIEGQGALVPGKGPARTGVTVILPHSGDLWQERVSGGSFVLNGNGAMTGLDWVRESGLVEGPIALTNTHSVGDVYRALIRWMIARNPAIGVDDDSYLPIVGECDDSALNDAHGFHVREEHVFAALSAAASGPVSEGAVGAGTGMSCYDFKGGIGTASRLAPVNDETTYTVGVLVNCNHGDREQLKVDGVPVGQILETEMATVHREGSICIIVATDAPLTSRQLERLAKRAAMGLARTGSTANDSSGDIILAFSNGRKVKRDSEEHLLTLSELSDGFIDPLFKATVEATEEAVLNALCMATTVVGRDGNVAPELPLERVRQIMAAHGRIK